MIRTGRPRASTSRFPAGSSTQRLYPLILLLGALAGCKAPPRVQNPAVVPAAVYERALDVSAKELERRGYEIDRRDYRFGVLTTHPVPAQTVFEPWQMQGGDTALLLEHTLNEERLVITVSLEQPGDSAAAGQASHQRLLRVEATIERSSHPLRILTGSTFRGSLVGSLRELPAEQRTNLPQPAQMWYAVGRDSVLEQRILRAVLQQLDLSKESSS